MIAAFCSLWLLLQDNHCNFSEILGPLSSFIYGFIFMVGDLKIEAVSYSETLLNLCQTTRCSKVDRTARILTIMPLVCLMWEIFRELNCKYQTDFTA
jgi:hypothetical protein